MTILQIIIAAGLPSTLVGALVGLLVWRLKKQIEKDAEEQRKRDAARLDYEVFQTSMVSAVAALSKANAIALQNGKCNGETHAALEYLEEVKHDQRRFLVQHGIEHIYEKI